MPAAASARPSAGERAEHRHREPRLDDFLAEHLAERDRPAERLLRVDRPHLGADRVEQPRSDRRSPRAPPAAAAARRRSNTAGRPPAPARSRSPAFRVLAMTPTMVTSAPRLTSISVPGRRLLEHAEPQPGADRILPRRPQRRGRLVDHRHAIAALDLRRVEHPSAPQRDAEGAQMIGARRWSHRAAATRPDSVRRS